MSFKEESIIGPDRLFQDIEVWVNNHLSQSDLPQGFEVELMIWKNTLTFNLINEEDIKNIVKVIKEVFDRMIRDSKINKPEIMKEEFNFPFETVGRTGGVLVTIKIILRHATKWNVSEIRVKREY